jgi:hypothetical protein
VLKGDSEKMAIRLIREVNRSEGKAPVTGVDIIAGQPLLFATATTVRPYNDATFAAHPYGLAAESTAQLPLAPATGLTAGEGYDYTNFARGGLVSVFMNGGEFELFDDGRGAPYETGDTYALNAPVYAKENGKVTADGTGGRKLVGSVVDVEGSPVTRLRIKLAI